MPRGQVVTIPSGTGQLITTLSREEMDSVAVLNPNDGVVYVKLNSAANPTTPAWDWKVPSQSYAQLPGPYQSLGLWYQDQSGSNAAGQVNVYDSATQVDIPSFVAIGRAAQVAGTQVDITQGTIPQNPPANTSRLWVDGSGTLHLLDSSGNDRVEIDANNVASYVQPLINATGLGGDLYGTIPNGHISLANNSVLYARDSSNNSHNALWMDPQNMLNTSVAGGQLFRILNQADTVDLWHLDNSGNMNVTGNMTGAYWCSIGQWFFTAFGYGLQVGDSNHKVWFDSSNNCFFDNYGIWQWRAASQSFGIKMQLDQNGNLSLNSSLNLQDNQWVMWAGSTNGIISDGTNLYLRSNGVVYVQNTGGAGATIQAAQFACSNQFQWTGDGSYSFVSGGYIYFRASSTNGIAIQSTGGSPAGLNCASINTNGNGVTCGAVDSTSGWIRSQSGTYYLTANGDRMTDGGDNNNWVFYGPMGSVNYVFQHRDSSWMGTQAANFQTMSDWKAKLNVTPITDEECLERLRTPEIPIITWDAHGSMERNPTQRDIGFSAQDMETAVPEVVSIDNEGSYFLSYGNLTAVLWGALRLLDQRLTDHMNSQHPGPPNYGIPSASVAP